MEEFKKETQIIEKNEFEKESDLIKIISRSSKILNIEIDEEVYAEAVSQLVEKLF